LNEINNISILLFHFSVMPKQLTERELEILSLIVQELTSREIAGKLNISKQTVDTHRINIMHKTGSKSLVGLIKYALQSGITEV
jgi:DNA-binding CsgD family transcriptional regulator